MTTPPRLGAGGFPAMRKFGNEATSGSPAELRATTVEQAQLWGIGGG